MIFKKAPNQTTYDRAFGALLGQSIGDSLGAQVEFASAASIQRNYPEGVREMTGGGPHRILPGQVTDDTELALGLARSLVEHNDYNAEAVARAYAAWKSSGPFDCGATCGSAFSGWSNVDGPIVEKMLQRASNRTSSEANGSLMRISPLGVYGWLLPADVLSNLAHLDSGMSHASEMCRQCCDVFTYAIAYAIREEATGREVWQASLAYAYSKGYERVHGLLLNSVIEPTSNSGVDGGTQGWVVHAFQAAFHHALFEHPFERAVVETIDMGGDTDTNAAIVGALVGAVVGAEGIPERYKSVCLNCKTGRGPTYQTTDLESLSYALVLAVARRERDLALEELRDPSARWVL